ncbi:MAG: TRAP transporter small permease subunit [Pseudomonadales bacterium]|nr:TRAP transporter small permease subunit [Pseudomonadales bacterium]
MLILPHTAFSAWVECQVRTWGQRLSWIWILLLGVIVLNVIMRYLFAEGRIEFEEIQWHLYSFGFLFGLSFAYVSDSHIRVDVVREKLSPDTRAWVELYGILLLLLPFILLVLVSAIPFVQYSWANSEVSQAPGGLPLRWLVKGLLPLSFLLLLIVTLARLSRVMAFLFGFPAGIDDGSASPTEPLSQQEPPP